MADVKRSESGDPRAGGGAEIDGPTGQVTTGHEWDGIKELDTPMPRWWLWTFYATVVWGVGYAVAYPAWPLLSDATRGVLGWSSRGAVAEQLDAARAERAPYADRIAELPLEEIRKDPELLRFAVAGGRSAFHVNCAQCHGSGAAGSPGYPNLNDDAWIWGGTLQDIETTIRHGARDPADSETRLAEMPAFGADAMLDREQIAAVTEHVLSLSGSDHDAVPAATGAGVYADNCAACHGDAGQGDPAAGAPALNDAVWLYEGGRAAVTAQIEKPRHGVMPAWGTRLDPTAIKQLTLYVHGLGGGVAAAN